MVQSSNGGQLDLEKPSGNIFPHLYFHREVDITKES